MEWARGCVGVWLLARINQYFISAAAVSWCFLLSGKDDPPAPHPSVSQVQFGRLILTHCSALSFYWKVFREKWFSILVLLLLCHLIRLKKRRATKLLFSNTRQQMQIQSTAQCPESQSVGWQEEPLGSHHGSPGRMTPSPAHKALRGQCGRAACPHSWEVENPRAGLSRVGGGSLTLSAEI